jgi:hypothetical protein
MYLSTGEQMIKQLINNYHPELLHPEAEKQVQILLQTPQVQQYLRREVLTLLAVNLEDLNEVGSKTSYDFIKGIQRGIELLYQNIVTTGE